MHFGTPSANTDVRRMYKLTYYLGGRTMKTTAKRLIITALVVISTAIMTYISVACRERAPEYAFYNSAEYKSFAASYQMCPFYLG